MRAEPTAANSPVTSPARRTLHWRIGDLSLRQRFMVAPLLALILISVLTAAFVDQGARQAALLDRIAKTNLVEYDLHADVMNELLVEHLAMHSMLANPAGLEGAAFTAQRKVHLERINDGLARLGPPVAGAARRRRSPRGRA